MISILVAAVVCSQSPEVDAGSPVETASTEETADAGIVGLDAGVPEPSIANLAEAAADREPQLQTVVTGTRTERRAADAIVATEVITRGQIEATGARDLAQLLSNYPGIDVVYTFRGAGLRLSGLDPEYALLLIDGERVTGRVGNTLDLSRFSLRDVERIEIVKGPTAALYGSDAIGGVVNLITRGVHDALELQGSVAVGMFRDPPVPATASGPPPQSGSKTGIDLRAHGGSKLGPLALRVGAGHKGTPSFDLDVRDAATNGSAVLRDDLDAEAVYDASERITLGGRVSYLRRTELAVDSQDTGAVFDRRGRSESFDASVWGKFKVSDDALITARVKTGLFRDQLMLDQRGSRVLDSFTRSFDRIWEASVQGDIRALGQTFTGALEYLSESLSTERLVGGLGQRQRLGVVTQTELDFTPGSKGFRAALLPGVRVDIDTQFGQSTTPRLALKIDPTDWWTARLSYGWGFRAPSFQELYLRFENFAVGYSIDGNPTLRPEQSQSVSVSTDIKLPLEGWTLSGSLFRTDVTDLIAVQSDLQPNPVDPVSWRYGNIASATTQGAELSARFRLSRGAYLEASYSLTHSRDNTTGQLLDGRAVHRAHLQASAKYRPAGLEVVARLGVVGPRAFHQNGTTLWTSTYVDLDGQISYQLWDLIARIPWDWLQAPPKDWLTIFVSVSNALDAPAATADKVLFPKPPRTFYFGATVKY